MVLIAIWDTLDILFIKIRIILILYIVVLSLFFYHFFFNGKKTINFWLALLIVLSFTLIYLCDLSLSEYFIKGEGSLLYAMLTGNGDK